MLNPETAYFLLYFVQVEADIPIIKNAVRKQRFLFTS